MTKDASIGFQILRSIRRIIRKTSQHSRNVGRQGGVSVPQMLCMKAISEHSEGAEVTVAMVASTVQLTAPTVSRILDRLEKNGYVLRERNSTDRRKVCLSLTAEGRTRVQDLPTPLHQQFLTALEKLAPEETRELLTALERIVELMDAEDIDASPMLIPELNVTPDAPFQEPSEADIPCDANRNSDSICDADRDQNHVSSTDNSG